MARERREDLAAIVRRERVARGWPQEQLADAAGVSLRTVQRVERGRPCAGETIQALASALEVDAAALSAAAPAGASEGRWLGLTAGPAFLLGAALCLPSLAFVAVNIGYYELGLTWMAGLRPEGAWGDVWASPWLVLGGPLAAFALNAPLAVSLKTRRAPAGLVLEGVLVRACARPWAIAGLAMVLAVILMTYGTLENLSHMIYAGGVAPAR